MEFSWVEFSDHRPYLRIQRSFLEIVFVGLREAFVFLEYLAFLFLAVKLMDPFPGFEFFNNVVCDTPSLKLSGCNSCNLTYIYNVML